MGFKGKRASGAVGKSRRKLALVWNRREEKKAETKPMSMIEAIKSSPGHGNTKADR